MGRASPRSRQWSVQSMASIGREAEMSRKAIRLLEFPIAVLLIALSALILDPLHPLKTGRLRRAARGGVGR